MSARAWMAAGGIQFGLWKKSRTSQNDRPKSAVFFIFQPPKLPGWIGRFRGIGGFRGFRLSQGFIHALLEVAPVVVLESAIV